ARWYNSRYCHARLPMIAISQPTEAPSHAALQPVLSPGWALQPRHLLVTIWFGLFGMMLNYTPLYHTDLWSHVQYGGWILEHQTLPSEDLFQPLSKGMPVQDSAWGAQAIFAQVEAWGGAEALSTL